MMIVEEGLNYFQSLLADIQKAYRFSLEAHFEEDLTTLPGTKNRVRHALYSCQKIILSMGDLARYREQYNPNPNYSQAKKWYEMALQVNPKNGRPFNQLAIIAVSQYESMNLKKPPLDNNSRYDDYKYSEQKERRRDGSLRQEIWIRPDSGATNKRTLSQSDPEEEKKACIDELMLMPHDQLMKQFLTSYLHCHGMLFSRVGLDHFNKVLGETLNSFQALLQISPPKLSCTHLLQIMAINMFAIDNTQLRGYRIVFDDAR
ncbi:Telomerase-binding protein EST1A [Armadillidium nasatum]|uniref:Telomerase-binding protein EST1A n=1 Tax=Armadillidium nasatum TaxID=96803 RepID=A0A5N5TFH3_9CRUS|nr:Telomerase-binding protein EST1A [Armadillidium nasatum]